MMSAKRTLVDQTVNSLAKQHKGKITPQMVVAAAVNVKSPLHEYFEWDDSKAGVAHRLEQARSIIRSVRIVYTTTTSEVRSVVYVRDPSVPLGKTGYIAVAQAVKSHPCAQQVLQDEFDRVESAFNRMRNLAAVFGLEKDVDKLLRHLKTLSAKVKAAPKPKPGK